MKNFRDKQLTSANSLRDRFSDKAGSLKYLALAVYVRFSECKSGTVPELPGM